MVFTQSIIFVLVFIDVIYINKIKSFNLKATAYDEPDNRHNYISIAASKDIEPQSAVVTNGTEIPPTISPPQPTHYIMFLNHSGPAVLDSTVTFTAELIPVSEQGLVVPMPFTNMFVFQWMNMANMKMNKTESGLRSQISLVFPSNQTVPGQFPMTVAAFLKDEPTTLKAFQTRPFELTESLNGLLKFKQNGLKYQRNPLVFSTKLPIYLTADVKDKFSSVKPTFEYFWYQNFSFFNVSDQPNITTKVSEPDTVRITADIIGQSERQRGKVMPNIETRAKLSRSLLSGATSRTQRSNYMDIPFIFKLGSFQKVVSFKDPLVDCQIERVDTDDKDRGIVLGDFATLNVTCNGSWPSSICINITGLNQSISDPFACKPVNFTDSVRHQVKVKFNTSGWKDVHIFVYNDISKTHIRRSFYGFSSDSPNVTSITLPVVFGILAIVVIFAGFVYIMRIRKKPFVEVADFDFHPNLTHSIREESRIRWSRIVNSLKYIFSGRERRARAYPTSKNLNSFSSSDETESKTLYDSL